MSFNKDEHGAVLGALDGLVALHRGGRRSGEQRLCFGHATIKGQAI